MEDSGVFWQILFEEPHPALISRLDTICVGLFVPSTSSMSAVDVLEPSDESNPDISESRCTNSIIHLSKTPKHVTTGKPQVVRQLRSVEDVRWHRCASNRLQVYFIRQRHSYSPLSISRPLFQVLLESGQIPACFVETIALFGERELEIEIAPNPPCLRVIQSSSDSGSESALQFIYTVRYVDLRSGHEGDRPSSRWALRQSAVYGCTKTCNSAYMYLFVTLSQGCQQRLTRYLEGILPGSEPNPFELHLLIYDTVIANWRFYLVDLTTEIDAHATRILGALPDNTGPIGVLDPSDRQSLMLLEEKVLNAMSVVKGTQQSVLSLHEFYRSTWSRPQIISQIKDPVDLIFSQNLDQLKTVLNRLDNIHRRLSGIDNLVSSFLDLSGSLALQDLAKESRQENEEMRKLSERMHILSERSTRDAASVKVLTIITLIYLPATVVSNFFSTSFVVTDDNNRIAITGDWWIFVVCAVPLTLLTVYIWWTWMRMKAYGIFPFWWRTKTTFGSQIRRPYTGTYTSGLE